MEYLEALEKATRIKNDLSPFCDRIEIAGSIRREKPTGIKDVEIVCVPKRYATVDMFGTVTGTMSMLENALPDVMRAWRATSTKNGEKYKAIVFPDATKLDLFIVNQETWGYQFAIRTGPADYSRWLVTPRKWGGGLPSYLTIKDARVWNRDKILDTSEEDKFFHALEITPTPLPIERAAPMNFSTK